MRKKEIHIIGIMLDSNLLGLDAKILDLLLIDRSTKKNIVWATSDYLEFGEYYAPECEITVDQLIGHSSDIIKPRVSKAKKERSFRTRDKAEVFTPSWVCNLQNNIVDEQWFGRSDVFNVSNEKKWRATEGKIRFPDKTGRTWQDYVRAKRMEITCGEAPYLVSRYDTVTGKAIDIQERIGLLDRKLRVIAENTDNETDWLIWVKKAYQSIYGYEYQGDNLLLARENLLFTFIEYMEDKFDRQPTLSELLQIALIVSWNIWQMDGLSYTVPYSEVQHKNESGQLILFDMDDGEELVSYENRSALPCVVRDWTNKKYIEFRSIVHKRGVRT